MTTKVTINTHAGWPVEVLTKPKYIIATRHIVEPNEIQTFYIHQDRNLEIRELSKPDADDLTSIGVRNDN